MSASRRRSVTVQAGQDHVWGALAVFDDIAAWAGNVDHSSTIERSDDGAAQARRVQVGRQTLIERITAWDPPNRLAYQLEGLPSRLGTITNEWTLAASGSDTEVTITTTVSAGSGPPAVVIERAVSRKIASESEVLLAGFAEHCASAEGAKG